MREGHGVEGEAHAGPFVRHRYLARGSLACQSASGPPDTGELFDTQRRYGYEVGAGELGENIARAGLDLERMPLGSRMWLGSTAVVELTGLRTPCVLIDRFRSGLKRRVISPEKAGPAFRCGILGIVRTGGRVAAAISRERCCRALPCAL
ncbi:MOSC domain-containing protein [Bradyrhizobium japonicum]|uniref:MOSC domain-containing protein n=1 Tax=Bradyrhizobium japonicum TaxID=375 RepID=UPI0032E50004